MQNLIKSWDEINVDCGGRYIVSLTDDAWNGREIDNNDGEGFKTFAEAVAVYWEMQRDNQPIDMYAVRLGRFI